MKNARVCAPRFTQVFIVFAGFTLLPAVKAGAQACNAGNSAPLNGFQWASSGTKNVYVDPNLSPPMEASIRQAAIDFSTQTGQAINVLASGSPQLSASTQNSLLFLNNPKGSPNSFARTQGTDAYSQGVDTHTQVSATTSFNTTYQIVPASNGNPAVPAYDPNQPNASQYIYDATLHELGHAFGPGDTSVPVNPSTGQPDYTLQPAGASIMNGSVSTNDQGPHITNGQGVPGGVGATSVQACDKVRINNVNPLPTPSSSGGGSDDGGGGGSAGSNECTAYSYDEWDDENNTEYTFVEVVC